MWDRHSRTMALTAVADPLVRSVVRSPWLSLSLSTPLSVFYDRCSLTPAVWSQSRLRRSISSASFGKARFSSIKLACTNPSSATIRRDTTLSAGVDVPFCCPVLLRDGGAPLMCTTNTTVSNWERGKSQPHRYDRDTLRAIIAVLLRCMGLANLTEASALLNCGGYAALSQEEIHADRGASPTVQTQPHLGTTTVADDTVVIRLDARVGQARTLIAIRHQSMEQISARAILESLLSELRECACIEIAIDQCDLFHTGRLIDPY